MDIAARISTSVTQALLSSPTTAWHLLSEETNTGWMENFSNTPGLWITTSPAYIPEYERINAEDDLMEIKLIKTEGEYQAALTSMRALKGAEPGSAGEDELEVLALLVEKYEHEHHPTDPADPIEAIQLRMEQRGLTRKDMIQYLGSQSKVSEVLNYKRPLSLSMIRNLYEGLGIPAEVLLQVQPRHIIKATLSEPEKTAQAEVYTNCAQLTEELNQGALQEWLSKARQLATAQESARVRSSQPE